MSYRAIASQTLGSAAATVEFANIPQTFRDLIIVQTGSLTNASPTDTVLRVNGDDQNNYTRVYAFGDGSSTASAGETMPFFRVWYATQGQSMAINHLFDYSQTDKHKTLLSRQSGTQSGVGVSMQAQRWASTSAVTNLLFSSNNNFAAGTTFSLYGVSA